MLKSRYLLFSALALFICPEVNAATDNPSDAQIAQIVVTANTLDADAGKMAKEKTKNAEITKFADSMVQAHTESNQEADALVKKLKVKPMPSSTAASMKLDSTKEMARLKSLSGAAFDKAYIDHEVAYHQKVLETMDKTLIPSAKNAELKMLLEKTRPVISAHLEHAKHLQSTLK